MNITNEANLRTNQNNINRWRMTEEDNDGETRFPLILFVVKIVFATKKPVYLSDKISRLFQEPVTYLMNTTSH